MWRTLRYLSSTIAYRERQRRGAETNFSFRLLPNMDARLGVRRVNFREKEGR